jgi:2-iminobutanoate/2-iminopropanoate deaminase
MENKKVITGSNVPKSFLPFSPGIRCGQFLFISGQASVDLGGNIVPGSFEEECRRSFENLKAILGHAGLSTKDVIQVRNYVGKQEDLPAFNKIYKEYFNEPYPARTTLIGCLGNLLKFEVEAIASY